jgi:isochorismate hydrolase
MLRADRLDVDRAFVFVVDLQEKLLPLIQDHKQIVAAGRKLLDVVRMFDLPVLATEQYPKGVGRTVGMIREALETCGAPVIEKPSCSACDHPPVRDAMLAIDRPQAVLIGIEAHVCVQQTVLDLLSMGYDVFVCADAVGSRGHIDYEMALARMRQRGANVTTVESVLFELCNRCDMPEFKKMIDVIKSTPPAGD